MHVYCISDMSDIGLHSRCKDVAFPPYTCVSCILMIVNCIFPDCLYSCHDVIAINNHRSSLNHVVEDH